MDFYGRVFLGEFRVLFLSLECLFFGEVLRGFWESVFVVIGLEGRLGSWEFGYLLYLREGFVRWEIELGNE